MDAFDWLIAGDNRTAQLEFCRKGATVHNFKNVLRSTPNPLYYILLYSIGVDIIHWGAYVLSLLIIVRALKSSACHSYNRSESITGDFKHN